MNGIANWVIWYNLLRTSLVVSGMTSTRGGDNSMEFKKIHAPSSTDLFVNQLKTAILTGEYQPGDQLPSERELEK